MTYMTGETNGTGTRGWSVWALLVGILVTAAVYLPMVSHGFVNLDDPGYVVQNPHVRAGWTGDSIQWAFGTFTEFNWHPLTWLSHMLDCELFGPDPGGHHLTSLIFHLVNSLLFFVFLRSATGRIEPSAFAAAVFALHPLHVESVAWVSERKDVLSAFFFFLALLAYLAYARRRSGPSYLACLLLFAAGLMSKPMVVTLPFVLLLLDYWPLHRRRSVGILVEKAPFFLLAALSCWITFKAQHQGGAVAGLEELPLFERTTNALLAYLLYLVKTAVPLNLSVYYPHFGPDVVLWKWGGAACVLGIATFWALRNRGFRVTGWFWFLGMLVPVIGLVQVGNHAMADRYAYLPMAGLLILIAWGAEGLVRRHPSFKRTVMIAGLVVPAILAFGTWRQVGYWCDSKTLFEHALAVTENNHVAHNNLGFAYMEEKQWKAALPHFREALRIQPDSWHAAMNLGIVCEELGMEEEAASAFREALRIQPDALPSMDRLAWCLATGQGGDVSKREEALVLAEKACNATGYKEPLFLDTLAAAYAALGRFEEARAAAAKAARLALAAGMTRLQQGIRDRLEGYGRNEPWQGGSR